MTKLRRTFIAYGHFLFKARNWLFPLVLIPLCLIFPPINDRMMHVIGLLAALLGLAVRASVIGLVYIKRGGIGKKIAAPELVTDGMFRHGRNPLYLGNLLIVAGILLVQNNPWTYLVAGSFFLISYSAIVAAEEEFLYGKFGQAYRDYCAATPRWLIDPRGLGKTLSGMRFNWQRVVSKDYGTAATCLTTIFLVLAWEDIANAVDNPAEDFVAALLIVAGALLIRSLKRTGRLEAA